MSRLDVSTQGFLFDGCYIIGLVNDWRGWVRMDKTAIKIIKLGEENPKDDLAYWLSRPVKERIEAVEILRREYYGSSARLQRNVVKIIKLSES